MQIRWLATDDELLPAVRRLFKEYADSLGEDFYLEGYEDEMRDLPGQYAAPTGALLVAVEAEEPVACGAIRYLQPGIGEVKRMYVKPAFRKQGLGRAILDQLLEKAVRLNYQTLRLDTMSTFHSAVALYRATGFEEIDPYYDNPLDGVIYLEKVLGTKL